MLDIVNFPLFLISVLVLMITPGPDLAYVVGQSIANGRRSGVISASGVALGSLTHTLASAIGLTALIAASPTLFMIIKYIGAAYLMYLGAKMLYGTLFNKQQAGSSIKSQPEKNTRRLLARGFITTVTNPKVLIFFVAFFPQFVTIGGDHQTVSFLILGCTYALSGFLVDASFALLAGSAASVVAGNNKFQLWIDRVVGLTFISLGIRIALTRR